MNEKKESRDVYAFVTNRIIEQMEKGVVPWQKPWDEAGMPKNLITGRAYRGINIWLLAPLGYAQNYFLTFKQVKDLGATVKKDEKGILIVFWKWIDINDEETGDSSRVPFLRYMTVFNIAQCEGIPEAHLPALIERKNNPLTECEAIIENMPQKPEIKYKENKAYYHPLLDFVNMPKAEKFKDSTSFYSTLFHELIHSTGHMKRLNRKEVCQQAAFGSEMYSVEELTAEIGACYLKSYAGIGKEYFQNSASYIKGWLEKLRSDKRFIVYASTLAQKATDFILNVKFEEKVESKPDEIISSMETEVVVPVIPADDLPF